MQSRIAWNTKLSVGLGPAAICGLEHDLATLAAAQTQVGGLKPRPPGGRGHRAGAAGHLAQAKLNLPYSSSPPWSGSVANKTVRVRDFVQPGRTLLSVLRGAKRDLHHCELQRDPDCISARGSIGQRSSRRTPRREAARRHTATRHTATKAGRVRASLCCRMRWAIS
jgi:hypothetical protein